MGADGLRSPLDHLMPGLFSSGVVLVDVRIPSGDHAMSEAMGRFASRCRALWPVTNLAPRTAKRSSLL